MQNHSSTDHFFNSYDGLYLGSARVLRAKKNRANTMVYNSNTKPPFDGKNGQRHHPSSNKANVEVRARRSSHIIKAYTSNNHDENSVKNENNKTRIGVFANLRASILGSKRAASTEIVSTFDDSNIAMKGWLEKCGRKVKSWKRRYFILRDNGVLYYYKNETLTTLKGELNIGCETKAREAEVANVYDKKHVFMVETPSRTLLVAAPSAEVMNGWIEKLNVALATISRNITRTVISDYNSQRECKTGVVEKSHVTMEGLLLKRGHVNRNWKERYFRIENGELRYYASQNENLKGSMDLQDYIVSPGMPHCSDGRKNYFALISKDGAMELHLNSHDASNMYSWIKAIQAVQKSPVVKCINDIGVGMSTVINMAEEIPLAKVSVCFNSCDDYKHIQLARRANALIVQANGKFPILSIGSQVISVGNTSVLLQSLKTIDSTLQHLTFPLKLEFLLPPYKRGLLVKKSRSGIENWKNRVVIVSNGEIHYFKQVENRNSPPSLVHRNSFSLIGCYMKLAQFQNHENCIILGRSPTDLLILQASSEQEQFDWASAIYCSIQLVSQGVTSRHIENLRLTHHTTSTI